MRRVGKALLHLWHTEGHIGRREFTRKIIILGIFSFVTNFSLIMSFYQFDRTGSFQLATVMLWAMLFANLVFTYIFSRLVGKRINDVRGHVSILKGGLYTICTVLPYSGLYLLILLCRRCGRVTEQHHESRREWSLFPHTLIALILPILFFAPIRYTMLSKKVIDLEVPVSANLLYSVLYDFSEPGMRTILRIARASIISGVILEHCSKDVLAPCFEYSKIALKEGSGDTTEVLMQVATNSLQVFKKKEQNFYSANHQENILLASLELLQNQLELFKLIDHRVDQIKMSFPYGVYLFAGNIQIPLLQLIDRSIHQHFWGDSLKKLTTIRRRLDKLIADSSSLSEEKVATYKLQFEVLDREFEFLTTRYDYFMKNETR